MGLELFHDAFLVSRSLHVIQSNHAQLRHYPELFYRGILGVLGPYQIMWIIKRINALLYNS
jgi:hypothetical protein